ncbi:hypothetical protein ACTG11_24770 [Aeromonas hydrophila]
MVAVSSGGKAPVLVRLLRERLESLLPRHLGGLTELSGRVRDKAKVGALIDFRSPPLLGARFCLRHPRQPD